MGDSAAAASAPAATEGQWTYTNQYGWVWTPYGNDYTYVAPGGSFASSYLYYPSYGWGWVMSPWVLGWGPTPYWGSLGVARFGWYAHPWFHVGARWSGGFVGARLVEGRWSGVGVRANVSVRPGHQGVVAHGGWHGNSGMHGGGGGHRGGGR